MLVLTTIPHRYTINLLLLGFGLGLVLQYFVVRPLQDAAAGQCELAMRSYWADNVFVRSLTTLADLDPHLLLHIFIPPLIYESASAIEWHIFFRLKWTALLLAVPGVIASTYVLGFVVNLLYGGQPADPLLPGSSSGSMYGGEAVDAIWPTNAGTLLGVILSATDPVAVVALLKELGIKEELSIGIEAESLLNDGTALVFFNVMIKMVRVPPSSAVTPNGVVGDFLFQAGVGAVWGVGVGVLASLWLARVFNNPVIEITITLSSAYLAFYSAEVVGCSGVLAVVSLGLFMGKAPHP